MSAVATPETKQRTSPAASPPVPIDAPVRVIGPWHPSLRARFRELAQHLKLITYYGSCYIKRRYQNTWLGWIWLPLRPGLDMAMKGLLFGGFLGVSSGDRPYIVFFTFGSAGWVLFERTMFWANRSLRMSRRFLRGVHGPWLPKLAAVLFPAAMDFVLYVAVAVAAVVYYWIAKGHLYLVPSPQTLTGFAGIFLLGLWGLSVGCWTAPLSQYTRDVRYSFGYVLQAWYFVTPVIYPISQLPPQYQIIAKVNPLTAPVEMVKFGFLDTAPPAMISLLVSLPSLALILAGGIWSLNRFERAAVERL
jgi:lipopolysaccharide transport system permease protein